MQQYRIPSELASAHRRGTMNHALVLCRQQPRRFLQDDEISNIELSTG